MKKSKKIAILIVTILLLCSVNVLGAEYAGNEKMKIQIEGETEVKPGETKAVAIKIKSEETIGIISGKIEIDGNIDDIAVTGKNKWNVTYNSETGEFNILKAEGAKEEEILEIEYKAPNTEGTVRITVSDIKITTTGYETTEMDSITKDITIKNSEGGNDTPETVTLSDIEITDAPTKTKYTAGEKFDKTGMKVTAKYSDGSSKEIEGYTYSPAGELKTSDKEIKISYTEGSITKTAKVVITVASGVDNGNSNDKGTTSGNKIDKTTAGKEYPKTGAKTVILPLLLIAILVIVSYVGYKRYRGF